MKKIIHLLFHMSSLNSQKCISYHSWHTFKNNTTTLTVYIPGNGVSVWGVDPDPPIEICFSVFLFPYNSQLKTKVTSIQYRVITRQTELLFSVPLFGMCRYAVTASLISSYIYNSRSNFC